MFSAASYEIRTSERPLELRDNFENAVAVNTSSLTPLQAGYKEVFAFNAETFTKANITLMYVAVRTVDDVLLHSDVSNIAQAVMLLRQKDSPNTHAKYNAFNIILIACGLTASCLIISIVIWTLKKKKKTIEDGIL